VFVASYGMSSVIELDRTTGQTIGTPLPGASGFAGADNGMMVSAAGLLYVPGYDSSSVARVNPATGEVLRQFVAPRSGGLGKTRGIVDEGATILVGGEGSGTIHRFDAATGAHAGTLITGLARPTGLALAPDGSLLVLAGARVRRFDRGTGAELGVVAETAEGGISGGTFVALIPASSSGNVPITSGGSTKWVPPARLGRVLSSPGPTSGRLPSIPRCRAFSSSSIVAGDVGIRRISDGSDTIRNVPSMSCASSGRAAGTLPAKMISSASSISNVVPSM
jgi:DNA-binding beta-propeller fold protein YncE